MNSNTLLLHEVQGGRKQEAGRRANVAFPFRLAPQYLATRGMSAAIGVPKDGVFGPSAARVI